MAGWFFCSACKATDQPVGEAVELPEIGITVQEHISPRVSDDAASDASGDMCIPVVREISRSTPGPLRQRIEILQEVDIFTRLPDEQFDVLADAFSTAVFEAGDVVIKEGELGSEFFIIQAGTAHISVAADPSFSVQLGQGHWFGEKALLFDLPRMATVTAATTLAVLKLSREKFQDLGLNELVSTQARKCIHGEQRGNTTDTPNDQEESDTALVVRALQENPNLKGILDGLEVQDLEELAKSATLQTVPSAKVLIEQGSTSDRDDCFYIVKSGRFAVFASGGTGDRSKRSSTSKGIEMAAAQASASPGSFAKDSSVITMSEGMSFGELALLHAAPRNASVQALVDAEVFAIERASLRCVIEAAAIKQVKIKASYLCKVPLFRDLQEQELFDLAGVMNEFRYDKDEVILQQGDEGDTFYVMVEGKVGVFLNGKLTAELAASKTDGTSHCFGERALLQNEPRAATVKVLSDCAFMLSCDRKSFKFLLEGLFDLLTSGTRKSHMPQQKKACIEDMVSKRISEFGKLRRKLLKRTGILGFGALGVIELMEHRESGDRYALKVMSKGYIKKSGLQKKIQHTRDILIVLNSPFIVKLVEAYNGSQSLFFLMECCLGGDLLTVYNRKGLHGSLSHCKFYVASLWMAYEHLHSVKVIYRDTKPENIIVGNTGTLKLVDLDCAKFSPGKTFTVCGTPEYMAPEIMSMQGHTFLVDWWGIGILTFELLVGFSPFVAQSPMQVYSRVAAGIEQVLFPPHIKGPPEEFMKKIMVPNPSDRLPAKPRGIAETKKLKFWHGFNWEGLKEQKITPPYMPRVDARTKEAERFRPRPEDMPPQIVYRDDNSGWDKNFATCT